MRTISIMHYTMRIAEEIIANNFDDIRVAQLFTDDNCKIVRYNRYAKEYIESRSKFTIEELPLRYALSKKLLDAVDRCEPSYDTFFINYDTKVAEELKLTNVNNYYAFYAEYEPVEESKTGKVQHYFLIKDVTELMLRNFEDHMYSQKFHDLMVDLGVAHINFEPEGNKIDIVGGRDNHKATGVSFDHPLKTVVHPDDLQKGINFFKRAGKNTTKKHSTLLRIYSENLKEYRYFTFVLNPIYKPDGTFVKFSGFCIDVTDKIDQIKKHEEKANIKMNKLEKEKSDMEKTKSQMDRMLSVMGHDLRSPLSTILGFSELMVNIDSREEREEMFGFIQKSVGQMMVFVNDILESTRLDAGAVKYNISECRVADLLKDVYTAHLPMFKDKPVEFSYEIEGDVVIRTDKIRLAEILNNYMSNAIKYTNAGSVKLVCQIDEEGCYFHVIDTGNGIAKKDCEKAFNRYEMLGSEVAGTGLGLYICKVLAKGLGGRVGCVSDKGKGCDFWLWLPRQ